MYIELHCHSGFSFLDGTSQPDQLAHEAKRLGYPALALTDNNGLYGSMIFAQAARQIELQPITGAELTLLDGSHITLLAETPTGYANLCRNPGWDPRSQSSTTPMSFSYSPEPWEGPLRDGSWEGRDEVFGHYRWTRGGLLGVDFGTNEVNTGQS